jgi:transcription termination factor Rho
MSKTSSPADRASGVLKLGARRDGTLLDPARSLRATGREPVVPAALIREFHLPEGALVEGPARSHSGALTLIGVDSVSGLAPDIFAQRVDFDDLIPIDPNARFDFGSLPDATLRAVDLVAPIGKGTRGLIVSPPKAGKTTLLSKLATGIAGIAPETRVIVLLIDERPEEVTYFRRAAGAEVIASSSDRPTQEHLALMELMLAHIRVELECGRDVVVVLDSLTRLARAFNLASPGRGRSLSGGLEAGAMEMPRRFFGLARNVEGGGSVTVLASVLVDTGSRLDQVIFEELKATGNSEIVLDRALAEARIFPAINISASGTRREELLYPADDMARLRTLRRGLAQYQPKEGILKLLQLLEKYPTNPELLAALKPSS